MILVRHGEAYAGFHGPIAGPTGCAGLTPHGRLQAEALREHLAWTGQVRADLLLASVLPRAIETARIVAPGLRLELSGQDCDLCEFNTGEADGMDWLDYNDRYGSFDMEAEPDRLFAPGGESWNSFHERVSRTLERFARDARRDRAVPGRGGHLLVERVERAQVRHVLLGAVAEAGPEVGRGHLEARHLEAFVRETYVLPARQMTGTFPSHPPGTWAHLTVLQGTLDCCLDGGKGDIRLQEGDSVEFRADVAYGFKNPGRRPCELLLILDAGARPLLPDMG